MRAISFAAGLAMAAVACGGFYAEADNMMTGDPVLPAAEVERQRICAWGAAAYGRPTPEKWRQMKNAALAKAGISRLLSSQYQFDHIVPRCLDGSNELSNLQLQPHAIAKVKDDLERFVCRQYCAGRLSLEDARAAFVR